MSTTDFISRGFDKPTGLPTTDTERKQWQDANRTWWEDHPMRYDWREAVECEEFSRDFFSEIDRRFFLDVKRYMPWQRIPFDPLIDFDALAGKDVLEIGVGSGSHAQLLAPHARSYTGIDITDYAVRSTLERMKCFGIDRAQVVHMDAEQMHFEDNSFDYIWTWGVIHHSSNTERILQEMHRVLRPKGVAAIMVYHRSLWLYYLVGGLLLGIITGDLLRTRSLHKTVQKHTDGAIARYYTPSEWCSLVSEYFNVNKIQVYGSKTEMFPLPGGKMKNALMSLTPNGLTRCLTNRCRLGSFLVSVLEKK